MSNFEKSVEDFATSPVPDDQTVKAYRITLVLIGGMITLPVFFVGASLGLELGFQQSILVFTLAGLCIATIAAICGSITAKYRISTAMIVQRSFGRIGGSITSAIFGIAILGWYGATVDVFASAVDVLIKASVGWELPQIIYKLSSSLLMVTTAIFGFRALDRLSLFAVPVMALFLASLVYSTLTDAGSGALWNSVGAGGLTFAEAASAGIGAFVVAAVIMFPDLTRYSRTPTDAVIASYGGFGVGVPLVMTLAAIPTIAFADNDFLRVVATIGFGLQGLFLVLLATWTTNAFNLYSSSLVFASIFRNVEKWLLVLIVGIVGSLLALLPILDNFLAFLKILSIAIPPIAGVFAADFFIVSRFGQSIDDRAPLPVRWTAVFSWGVGIVVGYLVGASVLTITTVQALDALLAAGIAQVGITYFATNAARQKEQSNT